MDKEVLVLAVVSILLVVAVVQAYQLSSLVKQFAQTPSSAQPVQAAASANAPAGAGGSAALDTSGWTDNEKMNYEMHGQIPSRYQGQVSAPGASSTPNQVGGC